jgi:ABC-type phosphate transport system substrate-binding protein
MARRGRVSILVIAAVAWLGVVVASAAGADGKDVADGNDTNAGTGARDDYKIIVNPDNPVSAIQRQFLREAFLRKSSDWNNGAAIRPIDLSRGFAVRERFIHEVLRKSPSQLRSYWNQLIFSGKGVPPPEADTPAGVVAHVLAHPGGVGYLPIDADPGRAKVIRVQ